MGNSKAHKCKERNKGRKLDKESKLYFINQLKEARLEALRDAEGYQKVLHVIEKMGSYLTGCMLALGEYEEEINAIAANSLYATEIPEKNPAWHTPFNKLYELVRQSRNDAMHQGVVARHLTRSLVLMALVLEDAMKENSKEKNITDVMIRDVVTAELWQPISFVRQQMLVNSFTHLPVFYSEKWRLISDYAIVMYLSVGSNNKRKERLVHSVDEAIGNGLLLEDGIIIDIAKDGSIKSASKEDLNVSPLETSEIINQSKGKPILVTEGRRLLIGLITPFDML